MRRTHHRSRYTEPIKTVGFGIWNGYRFQLSYVPLGDFGDGRFRNPDEDPHMANLRLVSARPPFSRLFQSARKLDFVSDANENFSLNGHSEEFSGRVCGMLRLSLSSRERILLRTAHSV
jgi:hypothetical protein